MERFVYSLVIVGFAILAALGVASQVTKLGMQERNRSEVEMIETQFIPVKRFEGTLSFEMLNFDLEQGIASAEVVKSAKHNIAFYFDQVEKQCRSIQGEEFFLCANRVLGTYFYYTPSTELSNNLAKQQSDCDLNSYLIYDAARLAGLDAYVVYSPNHAFIGWRSESGIKFLETTTDNNKGSRADLSKTLYKKSLDRSYYTLEKHEHVFTIYQALVSQLSKDRTYVDSLPNSHENTLIYNAQFSNKLENGDFTEEDASYLRAKLRTDITSISKKLMLAQWFKEQKKFEDMKLILDTISPDSCERTCVAMKRELSVLTNTILAPFNYYDRYAKSKEMDITLKDYFTVLGSVFCVFVVLVLLINLEGRKDRK